MILKVLPTICFHFNSEGKWTKYLISKLKVNHVYFVSYYRCAKYHNYGYYKLRSSCGMSRIMTQSYFYHVLSALFIASLHLCNFQQVSVEYWKTICTIRNIYELVKKSRKVIWSWKFVHRLIDFEKLKSRIHLFTICQSSLVTLVKIEQFRKQ